MTILKISMNWEYEPDEQGKEVFHNIIGYENEKQIGIKEFCNKYRFNLKTKNKIHKKDKIIILYKKS